LDRYGGETFSGITGENFFLTGKATISSIPDNLMPKLDYINDTLLYLRLLGSAIYHDNANDVFNICLSFNDNSFLINPAADIFYSTYSNIKIDFIQNISVFHTENIKQNTIFPNPCDGLLYLNSKLMNVATFKIIDIKGKNIFSGQVCTNILDLHNIPSGLYYIIIETKDSLFSEKFILR